MRRKQFACYNEALHMLRQSAILALVAFCVTAVVSAETKLADEVFLRKQKTVWELIWRTDQPEMVPEIYTLGKSYNMEANLGSYKNEVYVKEFMKMYEKGMLPRGEIFSMFHPDLLDQAVALFKVFYTSKDFETLYKTAAWARIYLNEAMFVYAFSVAVIHHPETQKIRIPDLHEICPSLYFDNEVIRKAYNLKTSTDPTKYSSEDALIIHANRSKIDEWYNFEDFPKLSYFTEDVTLNNVMYIAHLAHPFWLSAKEFPELYESRGDRFFWSYRLQLARYYMERLSNGLGEVEDFDWDRPIPFCYYPDLSYHNGVTLPHRELDAEIPSYNYNWIKDLREWEHRISFAIDMGFYVAPDGKFVPFHTTEGFKTLGNLVEGSANSPSFDMYGSYDRAARSVLGFSPELVGKYDVLPSVMQLYGLDQRDPMYWSMIKKIMGFGERFLSKLPKYTEEELAFPGVKIESVDVDKVETFFTPTDYLISSAVKVSSPGDKLMIKARKYRLSHKPYTYTITVNSDKAIKAGIRIFVGPKYDVYNQEIDITENWKHFLYSDEWIVDLKVGTNKFVRSSTQSYGLVPDEVSGDVFYKKILMALEGKETFEIPAHPYGYPERMIIPKGKKDGFPYQFFIFISPYNAEKLYRNKSPVLGERELMSSTLGFPLDRPVFSGFTKLSNAYFKEFKVYHVEESIINKTVSR